MAKQFWGVREKSGSRETSDPTVQLYLEDLRRCIPLTRDEERKTLLRARKGDRNAINLLLTSNLRFVVEVAMEYQNSGVPLQDLIAEGNVGLITALQRFDETRGYKFISYAVWWIRQSILNAIKRESPVSMPLNRQEDMIHIARCWEQIAHELGREPEMEEVARNMNLSLRRAERALQSRGTCVSLDAPLDGDSSTVVGDLVPAAIPLPDEEAIYRSAAEFTEAMLTKLEDREKKVIKAYYGLDGQESCTLGEIGVQLGITRERVRQIKEKALGKLRRFLKSQFPVEEPCTWEEVL